MADMFAPLVAQLKANPKTIVFTEGNDLRILEATAQLNARGFLGVVLVGNEEEIKGIAAEHGLRIDGVDSETLRRFVASCPGHRYSYCINSTNVHFDIPKTGR